MTCSVHCASSAGIANGPVRQVPSAGQLLAWQARLEASLKDVRVIPQTHPGLGVA